MLNKQKHKFDLDALYPPDPPDRLSSSRELRQLNRIERAARRPDRSKVAAAWMATQVTLQTIGGLTIVAYVAPLPPWHLAGALTCGVAAWLAMYKLLRGWSL